MRCIFLLGGENKDLAREEVLALADTRTFDLTDSVLVCDADFRWKRLGLTKKVYQYLFASTLSGLESAVKDFDWKTVYQKSFSVRITNLTKQNVPYEESGVASHIWKKVDAPKVDLAFSQTPIEFIVTSKNVLCGVVLHESDDEFQKRRGHLRPENHPTTLNPRIARACVNLTGIKTGSVLTDPFCGSGGILIEAGLMRFKTVGYDIDSYMLKKCQRNLEFFKVKRFSLEESDTTRIDKPFEYVVTDLPYGLHSKTTGSVAKMYSDFLNVLSKNLERKAVVLFPHFVDRKALIRDAGLVVVHEFKIPVHSSLTRYIVLLKKKE